MAQEIITLDDLQKFRLQLLEDLKDLVSKSDTTPKQWNPRRINPSKFHFKDVD